MEDRLLTVEEVADVLRIPRSWIYGRIHARTLPFPMTKVGHYVRFPEAGVRDFIESATRSEYRNGNQRKS